MFLVLLMQCSCLKHIFDHISFLLTRTGSGRGFLNCQREKINPFVPPVRFKPRLTFHCSVIRSHSSTTSDPSKSTPDEASAQQQRRDSGRLRLGFTDCVSTSRTPYGLVGQFEMVQRFIYQDGSVSLQSENIKS